MERVLFPRDAPLEVISDYIIPVRRTLSVVEKPGRNSEGITVGARVYWVYWVYCPVHTPWPHAAAHFSFLLVLRVQSVFAWFKSTSFNPALNPVEHNKHGVIPRQSKAKK